MGVKTGMALWGSQTGLSGYPASSTADGSLLAVLGNDREIYGEYSDCIEPLVVMRLGSM